jgi:hypothetical protein
MELYDPQGRRLYLTAEERKAFLNAARDAPREVRTFCLVLHDTGCRISEALALKEIQPPMSEYPSVPRPLSKPCCTLSKARWCASETILVEGSA